MNLIPLIILLVMMLLGIPVGIALVLCVIPYFMLWQDMVTPMVVVQQMASNCESASMMAIPFFILAGVLMNYSGVTKRLMNICDVLVGHMPGGLAQVNVLLSTLMGGLCGSAAADCAMECKLLVPEMTKRGYPRTFSAAVTAASALITPMIPPGIGLIVYAYITSVSVGKMFVAGYVPGIMMCITYMIYVARKSKKEHYPPTRDTRASVKEVWESVRSSVVALLLPFILIFGLRAGIFTATEGGAICATYAFIAGVFIYKEIKPRHLYPIICETVLSSATVMLLMCATKALSYYLSMERIPNAITKMLLQYEFSAVGFLMMLTLLLIVLGMFMEGTAICILITPLIWDTAMSLSIDPIHLGVIMVMTMTIGALTPPFGTTLYMIGSLMQLDIIKLGKALMPYIGILIVMTLLFIVFPPLATFIPNLVY